MAEKKVVDFKEMAREEKRLERALRCALENLYEVMVDAPPYTVDALTAAANNLNNRLSSLKQEIKFLKLADAKYLNKRMCDFTIYMEVIYERKSVRLRLG